MQEQIKKLLKDYGASDKEINNFVEDLDKLNKEIKKTENQMSVEDVQKMSAVQKQQFVKNIIRR